MVVDQWELSGDKELRKLATVIRHRYVSGMTMEEIADDLGVSPATVYRFHTEAIAKLSAIELR